MADPLILDTNIFNRRDFLIWLETYYGRKILPIVAYAEICVKFINKNKIESLRGLLRKASIEIEFLEKNRAETCAQFGAMGKDFKDQARDYLIGAHVYPPPRTLITENKEHFWFIEEKWVFDPDEIMKKNR